MANKYHKSIPASVTADEVTAYNQSVSKERAQYQTGLRAGQQLALCRAAASRLLTTVSILESGGAV